MKYVTSQFRVWLEENRAWLEENGYTSTDAKEYLNRPKVVEKYLKAVDDGYTVDRRSRR